MNPRAVYIRRALLLTGIGLCLFLAFQGLHPSPSAGLDLQAVRQAVREAGSYRFTAHIEQSLTPLASPATIGQSTQQLQLHADGEVAGPDSTHMQLTFSGDAPESRLRLITYAGRTFLQQDAKLVQVENPTGLSTPNSDPLVWLEGAQDIANLGTAVEDGGPLTHYSFAIDGQELYAHLSAELDRQATTPAPQGVVYSPPDLYSSAHGTGDIWIDSRGFPVRQVIEVDLPGFDELHSAHIRVEGTFRDYGQVTRFPLPTQAADGAWRIQLTDIAPPQPAASPPVDLTALRLSPTGAVLLLFCLLFAGVVAWFRRRPRPVLVVVSLLVIVSLAVLPVLQSFQVVSFLEQGVQAAGDSRAALEAALDPSLDQESLPAQRHPASDPALPKTLQDLSTSLARCGDGSVSSDTDSDGLNDKAEYCLGTDPGYADTDRDLVPDNLETLGVDFAGRTWPSNPFEVDSNHDGLTDFSEWPAPTGEAPAWDPDGDGVPNLWDADNDGDGVPDSEDLSPYSYTAAAGSASLTLNGAHDAYTYIEIQVRPVTEAHLRFNRMVMDWPSDTEGQIQDLDASREDMRLMPLLEVITRQPPQKDLAAHYGASVFDLKPLPDGSVRMYLPLIPDGGGSRTNSFYTRLAYQPNSPASIRWSSVKMIWAVQGRVDHRDSGVLVIDDIPVQTYPEPSIRITGLRIEKNKAFESAVIGFPATPEDDLRLFNLTFGLSASFLHNQLPDLNEIVQRFSNPNTDPLQLWGIQMSPPGDLAAIDYAVDGHSDEGVVGLSSRTTHLLETRYAHEAHPSLILAYQQHTGHYSLDQLNALQTSSSLTIPLSAIPLDIQRGLRLTKYAYGADGWKAMDAEQTLSLVSQRFADLSGDLALLQADYPDLTEADLQALLINFYLVWSGGQVRVINLAGQPLAPDSRSDQEVYDLLAPDGTTSLPAYLLETAGLGRVGAGLAVGHNLQEEWSYQRSNSDSNVFGSAGALSDIINYSRTMIPGTADYFVPKLLIKTTTAIFAWRTAATAYNWASRLGQFAKSGGSWAGRMSASARTLGIIGTVVAVGLIWVNFGLTTDWDSRVSIVTNAVYAVVASIITVALFFISCNPVGAILVAILAIAEVICYLVSGGKFSIMDTVISAVASFFYDADILTELGDVNFYDFRTEAANPYAGISVGQVYKIGDTFHGEIDLTDDGGDGDLNDSYVYGEFRGSSSSYGTPSTQRDPSHCTRTSSGKTCKNDTWANFRLTAPGRNVTFTVSSYIRAKTVYEECVLIWGCWTSDTYTDLPEDLDAEDRWDPVDVTLDILPATLDAFASWTELTHLDSDGDGLLNTQEPGTGTRTDLWDTDGDLLSDYYEFHARDQMGVDPLQADGDGDGLDDALEARLRTRPAAADTDADGVDDGAEIYHFDGTDWVGGWQITLPGLPEPVTVLSNPKNADSDGDGLSDAAELANGLSPYSYNDAPRLYLTTTPYQSGPNGRQGMFALPGDLVTVSLRLDNVSPWPVEDTLELCLPSFFTEVSGGLLSGLPTPPPQPPLSCAAGFRWEFTGPSTLQVWQEVSATVTARIDPGLAATTHGEIEAHIPYRDTAGVEQVLLAEAAVVVDLDAPQVFLTAPEDGAFLGGGILDYVLGGASSDPSSWVERVELSLPGGPVDAVGVSPWAYTWDLPADGEYTLSARAFDLMGHASPPAAIHVTVDNTPPSVDTELVEGIFISGTPDGNDLVLNLRGTGSDLTAGLARIELSLDGKPWRDAWVSPGDQPYHTTAWEKDWEMPNDPSAQGVHSLTLRALDRAGNASQPVTRTVTADVQPPTSELVDRTFLEDPPHYPAGQEIPLRGVANDIGNLEPPLRPVELEGDLSAITQSTIWLSLSGVGEDDLGIHAAWLGDFNGDRLADLVVGLPSAQDGRGKVVVVSGRAGGWPNPPDSRLLDESRTSFTGLDGAGLGQAAVPAGDVNGDGLYDLAIGDPAGNRIFVVFGRPSPYGPLQTLEGPRENGWSVLVPGDGGSLGSRLAPAGDVNFDGVDDLLVADGDRLVLFAGQRGTWDAYVPLDSRSLLTIGGYASPAPFGRAGDLNGDRCADLAVSSGTGFYLFLGDEAYTPGSPQALTFGDADAHFTSPVSNPAFAALGDVNGDSNDDLIYATGSDPHLVFGGSLASLPFDHVNPRASGFLAAPGDVNSDGFSDILAGTEAGDAYLFLGHSGLGAAVPPPLVHATLSGVFAAASTLYPSGSDLNSDGSSDLLLVPDPVEVDRLEQMGAGFEPPSFIAPQDLPQGAGQPLAESGPRSRLGGWPTLDEVFTVDDDGCSGCFTTIGAAIQAAGSYDEIVVHPGVYPPFTLDGKNGLNIHGLNPDAVFIDGQGGDYAVRLTNTLGARLANLTLRNARSPLVLESAGVGGSAAGSETNRITLESVLVYDFFTSAIRMDRTSTLSLLRSTLAGSRNHIQVVGPPDPALTPGWQTVTSDARTATAAGGGLYAYHNGPNHRFYFLNTVTHRLEIFFPEGGTWRATPVALASNITADSDAAFNPTNGEFWMLHASGANASLSRLMGEHDWEWHSDLTGVGPGLALRFDPDGQLYALRGGGDPYLLRYVTYPDDPPAWVALGPAAPAGFGVGASFIFIDGAVYALRGGNTPDFYRMDLFDQTWQELADLGAPGQVYPAGAGADLAWDGGDWIYAVPGGNGRQFLRYHIPTDTWQLLGDGVSGGPEHDVPQSLRAGGGLVLDGGYLYAAPGDNRSGLYRFGPVGISPVKITLDEVAIVAPENATYIPWYNLDILTTPDFLIDGNQSTWVGGTAAIWSPDPLALPLDCTTYTRTHSPALHSEGIPSQEALVSTLTIPDSQAIRDLNVRGLNFYSTEEWLDVFLTSPAGTTVNTATMCPWISWVNIDLDDEADRHLRERCLGSLSTHYWDGESYHPYQPLASFDLQDSQGDWTLNINAQGYGDYWWISDLAGWGLEVCTGPTVLTHEQARLVDPGRDVYRQGQGSLLRAGYHTYRPDATVAASGGDFTSLQAAIDSGANRVLVQPGLYPQSFYLTSGVSVVGAGAELTVLQPSQPIRAEGVVGASLERLTLQGPSGGAAFSAEDGAHYLTFARNIVRGASTGILTTGQGTDLEVVNNTLVGNGTGMASTLCATTDVRNTIFAHNTLAGLSLDPSCDVSTLHMYNLYWDNGPDGRQDISPLQPGPGELFLDPLFLAPADHNYRTSLYSPAGNAGTPSDPAPPGAGERVDIGYIEQGRAAFYADDDYCPTCLNDSLTWGVDAFDTIQEAVQAARDLIASLGRAPEQPISVGVGPGDYDGPVNLPGYVRLTGSGVDHTTLHVGGSEAVRLDGAVRSEISGFTIQGADPSEPHWDRQVAIDGPTLGYGPSISLSLALLPNGQPRLAYTEPTATDLYYAESDGTTWTAHLVDARPGNGYDYSIRGVSLALDADGHPHISYKANNQDYTSVGLHYATWTGTEWQVADLDRISKDYTALALDSLGRPHIAYTSLGPSDSGNAVRYTYWDGSAWTATQYVDSVASSSIDYRGLSLQIDSQDRPHLSYIKGDNPHGYTIVHAAWDGAAWVLETVDSGSFWSATSLALDSLDRPHIAYHDSYAGLKYAARTPTWSLQHIDGGNAGFNLSLALDSAGNPHIGYSLDSTLRYVHHDGDAWTRQTIDSYYAGTPVSLAVDPNDRAHLVSYHNYAGANDFTYYRQAGLGTGVLVRGASNQVLIAHNQIVGNETAVRFEGRSTGRVEFNTLVNTTLAGVVSAGQDTWVRVEDNIIMALDAGLHTLDSGQIFNDYNLYFGGMDPFQDEAGTGLTQGPHEIVGRSPAFENLVAGDFDLLPESPAVDAANPEQPAPPGGGTFADLGANELVAPPLLLLLGKEDVSTAIGNSQVARVEIAVVPVDDPALSSLDTLPEDPATWQPLDLQPQDGTVAFWRAAYQPPAGGLYRVYTRAADHVDNQESAPDVLYEGAFVADDSPPTVAWITPDGSTVSSPFELKATASDYPAGELAVVETTFELVGPVTLQVPGAWAPDPWDPSLLAPRPFRAYLDAPGGVYTVTPYARDRAGNLGAGPSIQVTVSGSTPEDTTPPSLAIATPEDGAVTNGGTAGLVEFSGTATDNGSGVAGVEVSLDGGVSWLAAVLDGIVWSLAWPVPPALDMVSYPLRIRALDKAGNAVQVERTLSIDNAWPSGLVPVTFSTGQGLHYDQPLQVEVNWKDVTDGSATPSVRLAVDQTPVITPTSQVTGNQALLDLDTPGPWFIHVGVADQTGNSYTRNYGAWYVGDMQAACAERQQSILIDGWLDAIHSEWLDTAELLDGDERPAVTQELYATWDAGAFYLGWHGAWWEIDGDLWAYLDSQPGGSRQGADPYTQSLPFDADLAVQVAGPDSGLLYRFDGAAWQPEPLDFRTGPTGDAEIRIPVPTAAAPHLGLLAFALDPDGQPWSVFPTTNLLESAWTDAYTWSDPCASTPHNQDVPRALTVQALIHSLDDHHIAWSPGSAVEFQIELLNREPDPLAGALVNLHTSPGLALTAVDGVECLSCKPGAADWQVRLANLPSGVPLVLDARAQVAADLGAIEEVHLRARPEGSSYPAAVYRHAADGQPPETSVQTLPGNAIGAGPQVILGAALDHGPAGLQSIEVMPEGGAWTPVPVAESWTYSLTIPEQAEFRIYSRAVDTAGNASPTLETVFYIDQTPPTVDLSLPALLGGSPSVHLTGPALDPYPSGARVGAVWVQFDHADAPWQEALVYAPGPDGAQSWGYTWLLPPDDYVEHTLRLRAVDMAGNLSPPTGWQTTTVDIIAPAVDVTHAAVSIDVTAYLPGGSGASVLSGAVFDPGGLRRMDAHLYDPRGGRHVQPVARQDAQWSFTPVLEGPWSGPYQVYLEAVDLAGNVRRLGPYNLNVEDQAIAGLEAHNNGPITAGQEAIFVARLTAGTNVVFTWDFGGGQTAQGEVVTRRYWTEGLYTVTLTAANTAGSSQTTTLLQVEPGVEVHKVFIPILSY